METGLQRENTDVSYWLIPRLVLILKDGLLDNLAGAFSA